MFSFFTSRKNDPETHKIHSEDEISEVSDHEKFNIYTEDDDSNFGDEVDQYVMQSEKLEKSEKNWKKVAQKVLKEDETVAKWELMTAKNVKNVEQKSENATQNWGDLTQNMVFNHAFGGDSSSDSEESVTSSASTEASTEVSSVRTTTSATIPESDIYFGNNNANNEETKKEINVNTNAVIPASLNANVPTNTDTNKPGLKKNLAIQVPFHQSKSTVALPKTQQDMRRLRCLFKGDNVEFMRERKLEKLYTEFMDRIISASTPKSSGLFGCGGATKRTYNMMNLGRVVEEFQHRFASKNVQIVVVQKKEPLPRMFFSAASTKTSVHFVDLEMKGAFYAEQTFGQDAKIVSKCPPQKVAIVSVVTVAALPPLIKRKSNSFIKQMQKQKRA